MTMDPLRWAGMGSSFFGLLLSKSGELVVSSPSTSVSSGFFFSSFLFVSPFIFFTFFAVLFSFLSRMSRNFEVILNDTSDKDKQK